MARWLFKEEPTSFSFKKLMKDGQVKWDGIANPVALKNLRQVKKGDEIFFYETGKIKAVVGIMKAAADAVQGKTPSDVSVLVKPVEPLKQAVTLAQVKATPELKEWELARISRLSIMPVTENQWRRVLAMASD